MNQLSLLSEMGNNTNKKKLDLDMQIKPDTRIA